MTFRTEELSFPGLYLYDRRLNAGGVQLFGALRERPDATLCHLAQTRAQHIALS